MQIRLLVCLLVGRSVGRHFANFISLLVNLVKLAILSKYPDRIKSIDQKNQMTS